MLMSDAHAVPPAGHAAGSGAHVVGGWTSRGLADQCWGAHRPCAGRVDRGQAAKVRPGGRDGHHWSVSRMQRVTLMQRRALGPPKCATFS